MPSTYSSYHDIDPFYLALFERLWDQYEPQLPVIPTDIQDAANTKAAVFNLWVNFYEVKKYLMLQTDKTFSHAYDTHLANRLKVALPEHLKEIVQSFHDKHHHSFLYCYVLTLQVFQELSIFTNEHPELDASMLKKYHYYFLGDHEFEPNTEPFLILKILTHEFLQIHLTPELCEHMHKFAYHEMQHYLKPSI